MLYFLLRRAAGALLAIIGISTVVFLILNLTSDPAALLIPPEATDADYNRLVEAWGLDEPLIVRYWTFLSGIAVGNFGDSFRYGQPALDVVLDRVPATLFLALVSLAIAIAVAIPIGVISAVRRDSLFDRVASALTFVGQAMPVFWLGPILILTVAVGLGLLPTSGGGSLAHVVLPAITLASSPAAQFTRVTRSQMLEALSQDYVRTARSKGLKERRVITAHVLRNAAIPVVTIVGLGFGALLSGAIITETIFAWPGVGRLMIQSIATRDFPVVQTAVVLIAAMFVAVNLFVDLLYTVLDPRIRIS